MIYLEGQRINFYGPYRGNDLIDFAFHADAPNPILDVNESNGLKLGKNGFYST
jgi:hypothetical protein